MNIFENVMKRFGIVRVIRVEEGYEVTVNGETLTVTKDRVVLVGPTFYVEDSVYDNLMKQIEVLEAYAEKLEVEAKGELQ